MPDTHYVPSLAICAELKPARQAGELKATPMSSEHHNHSTSSPSHESVRSAFLSEQTSTIPKLGMTFRQAADRVRELLAWNDASGDRDENEDSEEGRQRAANVAEWGRIQDAMFATPAATFGDVLAKLERLACPEIGAGAFSIRPEELHAIAADVARLGAGSRNAAASMLLHTVIPALGMTFGEAAERYTALHASHHDINEDTDPNAEEKLATLIDQMAAIARAVSAAKPLTFGDGLAVLRIASHDGSHVRESDVHAPNTVSNALFEAMLRAAAFLSDTSAAATSTPAEDADLFALWNAYTTARDALNAHKGDDEEGERLADACRAAELAFLDAPARTAAGVALKFQYIHDEFALDSTLRAGLPDDVLKALDTASVAIGRLTALPATSTLDAAILAAWERYVFVMREFHDLPDDLTDADHQPYYDELQRLRTIIVETPARTAEGMAPKLRILFVETTCCLFVEQAMIGRTSPKFEEDVTGKQGYDMFMALIEQCEGRAVAMPCIPIAQPNTFADTIAAFEAEAPKPLCMPQAPTARMVEAAAATGVSAEQAQAIYAVMAEAYRKEHAA